mmetsp:Transcript_44858/g.118548  ORF Transcript_44858/g.118548 Transcript_44858/m.118548 type:complete len:232 (-) Transcript_44858:439-1134(-)
MGRARSSSPPRTGFQNRAKRDLVAEAASAFATSSSAPVSASALDSSPFPSLSFSFSFSLSFSFSGGFGRGSARIFVAFLVRELARTVSSVTLKTEASYLFCSLARASRSESHCAQLSHSSATEASFSLSMWSYAGEFADALNFAMLDLKAFTFSWMLSRAALRLAKRSSACFFSAFSRSAYAGASSATCSSAHDSASSSASPSEVCSSGEAYSMTGSPPEILSRMVKMYFS